MTDKEAAMLAKAEVKAGTLALGWRDATGPAAVSLFWLRDHCPCPTCLHPDTKQRQVDTFAIPADIGARRVELAENGRQLVIEWADDGHVSRFDAAQLAAWARGDHADEPARVLWDQARIAAEVPQVAYEAVMAGERGVQEWLEKIERYGFCFVEGTPATPEATQAVAKRVTYTRETIFGGYWDFTANMEHKDTAYTTLAVGPHTDGTYSFDAPGYQMFHCLAFAGEGGDSVFVDAFKVADILRRESPELYRALAEIEVTGQYIDEEKGIHLMATRPALRLDSAGRLVQVSFNNLDRAPMALPAARTELFYRAYGAFARLANERRLQYRRRLAPGSLVLFDNWRLLHARDAYAGYRRLAGVYLNKEDVESRLRALRLKAGAQASAA
jgi:trimethyllysine dioxygenase